MWRAAERGALVSDTDVELGPIDYLVVEWPAGKQPSGEGLPIIVDLVDRGVIRLLDLAFDPETSAWELAPDGTWSKADGTRDFQETLVQQHRRRRLK